MFSSRHPRRRLDYIHLPAIHFISSSASSFCYVGTATRLSLATIGLSSVPATPTQPITLPVRRSDCPPTPIYSMCPPPPPTSAQPLAFPLRRSDSPVSLRHRPSRSTCLYDDRIVLLSAYDTDPADHLAFTTIGLSSSLPATPAQPITSLGLQLVPLLHHTGPPETTTFECSCCG